MENPSPRSEQEADRLDSGRRERVENYLSDLHGQPLRRDPIDRTPHGENARRYSYSLVGYAYRSLLIGDNLPEANAAVVELADYYLDNPQKLKDIDSFHWIADPLGRLWNDFGPNGAKRRNSLTPEAREKLLALMWAYASTQSEIAEWEGLASDPWRILYSENHHHMKTLAGYVLTGALAESEAYRDLAF